MYYKKGKFIYQVFNENGDLLLYNVRTAKVLKVVNMFIPHFNMLFNQEMIKEEDIDQNPWINSLINDEFILPLSFDEVKWCKMKKNEEIYNTDDLAVLLIPTNECNFRCTYCFQEHVKNFMSSEAEKKVIQFFEKKIPKSRVFRLGLFGGEPLLCAEQLLRIASNADRICKENRVPMVGEISTNGYLLTPDLFKRLLKVRIHDFQVCVDGFKEQHNRTRPHMDSLDSYSVIMDNLKKIKKTVKGYFNFIIRINLTPSLETHMELFLQELAGEFKDDMRFQIAIQCVRDWGGNVITPDLIVDDESIKYEKWYSRVRDLGMTCIKALNFKPFAYCTAYRKNAYIIDYDASILKCTHAKQDENKVGYIDKNGNIFLDDWKLAKWFISDSNEKAYKQCEQCVLYPFCMEGFCPYSKNIEKRENCSLKITLSTLREKILDMDMKNIIKQVNI